MRLWHKSIKKEIETHSRRNRSRNWLDLLSIIQQIHCVCNTHYVINTLLKNRHSRRKNKLLAYWHITDKEKKKNYKYIQKGVNVP
jgi:hypothetical protein